MEGRDLTQGNLTKNMIRLLIPMIMTTLLNSLYNIVDGIWIGKLVGEAGIAAISNCYPITLMVTAVSSGFAIATSVMIAQYYGAKEEENIKKTMGTSYLFSAIVAIVLAIIVNLTASFWLGLLHTPEAVIGMAKSYLSIYMIGFIFNYILCIIMEALRAIGNSKISLLFVAIGTIINIVLDPILIQTDLGFIGAAYATSIAMAISTIVAVIYMNRKSKLLKIDYHYLKFKKKYLIQLLKVGIPAMIEQWLIGGVILFEVYISNLSGVIGSAAYGVVSKIEQVIFVIGGAFSNLATVAVGQFIGKGLLKEAKKVLMSGMKLILLPTVLILLFVFVIPRPLCSMFVSSEEVIKEAVLYLSVIGLAYLLLPLRQLINGFIIGTGHTTFTSVTAIIASVLEIIVVVLLRNAGIDNLVALGWGVFTWVASKTIVNFAYYFTNRWQKEMIEK